MASDGARKQQQPQVSTESKHDRWPRCRSLNPQPRSRTLHDTSIEGNTWKWWRDSPDFSQRFTCTITDDGRTMIGEGEMSRNGAPWEKDLALTYTKLG